MIGAHESPKTLTNDQLLVVLDFLALNLCMSCSSSTPPRLFTRLYPALYCIAFAIYAECGSSHVEPTPAAQWAPQFSPFHEICALR